MMDSRPSLARLTEVELRKATDTRAGRWLIVTVAALAVAVVAAQVAFGDPAGRTLGSLVATAQLPISVLLPVVGLLSVTGEWSQRTALATFSLVPDRTRVIAAKVLALTGLAVVAAGVGLAAGAAGFAVAAAQGRATGGWDLSVGVIGQLGLVDVVTMLCGTAFGLLILTSAPAIVAFYAVPIGWSAIGRLVPGLDDVAGWLDIGRSRVPLVGPGVTGSQWAMFLTSCLLWVALPVLVGLLRVRRVDIA